MAIRYNSDLQILRDGKPEYTVHKGYSKNIGCTISIDGTATDLTDVTLKFYLSKYETSSTNIIDGETCVKQATTGLCSYNITPSQSNIDRGVYYFYIEAEWSSSNKLKFDGWVVIK